MNMNDKDNNQKSGAPVPPSFGGEKPTPPTPPAFDGGAKPTPPPFGGAPKSAPAPPPVPASAKAEAKPVVEEAEEMTTSSKKKRTKSVTDKPKKKKKGCVAKGCMWAFIVFLFLGVIGVVFGEDESNKPTAPESSTAKVEQTTTATDDDDEASTAITSRKPFKGSVLALSPSKQYVNDYACILADSTVRQLEDDLRMYGAQTPAQIVVVTIADIADADPQQIAAEIGKRWSVGKEKDNGVVILVQPKTEHSGGKVAIAVGKGLEPMLTDVCCQGIVSDIMLPKLRTKDYYGAVSAAVADLVRTISMQQQ